VVLRLRARLADIGILVLDDDAHLRLHRWMKGSPTAEPPGDLSGGWTDEPGRRRPDYPSFHHDAPIFSRRALAVLGPELARAGRFLPVAVDGVADEYALYLVDQVVDCLDARRSSAPRKITGFIEQAVFVPDRLPDLPAFRVPQSPSVVYWTAAGADRVVDVVGDDAEAPVVWSLDPSRPADPHAYPH
jgi:hypothetical protein